MKRFFTPHVVPATAAALLLTSGMVRVLAQQNANTPPAPDAAAPESAEESAGQENGFNPSMPAYDRYEKIGGKSPFEFELAKPPETVKISPFADLVLAGFVGSGNRMTVYLQNTKKAEERITVTGDGVQGRKNDTGFKIVRVEKGPTLRSTKVILSKDGEEAAVSFNPEALNTMRGGATGGGGAVPGAPTAGNPRNQPGVPGRPNAPGRQPVAGAPAAAAQPFQTAQAYVPGRSAANNNAAQPAANTQQQGISQLLNNAPQNNNTPNVQAQAPPAVIIPQVTPQRGAGAPGQQPPKRRVVLPSQ